MAKNGGVTIGIQAALLLLVLVPPTTAAEPDPRAALARGQARLLFGPLPDRMPGSEHDTPERIALGKKLYFDPRLSVNDSQSCNTCHVLDGKRGGVDNEPTSLGALGKRGDRNAPTTLNAGFHLALFWDGRAPTLHAQAKAPVLNPIEMAMPSPEAVVKKLAATKEYPELFAKAFPDAREITYDNLAEALAAFERTLITHDRFDDFMNGDLEALRPRERKGLERFLTLGCLSCHLGPLLGGNQYQKIGVVHPYENPRDLGRYAVTQSENDRHKFKVPSLRNVALTHPYFHDGSQQTLKQAVEKMAWLQLGRKLSAEEADLLVAFLHSLTDQARAFR